MVFNLGKRQVFSGKKREKLIPWSIFRVGDAFYSYYADLEKPSDSKRNSHQGTYKILHLGDI